MSSRFADTEAQAQRLSMLGGRSRAIWRKPHVPGRELLERVTGHLQQSSYPEVRRVACQLDDGVLRMYGNVPSWYLKQVALSIVRHSAGENQKIDDCLCVDGGPDGTQTPSPRDSGGN